MSKATSRHLARTAPALAGLIAAAITGACASSGPADTALRTANTAQPTPDPATNESNWQRLATMNHTGTAQPTPLGAGDRLGRAIFERFQAAGNNSYAAAQPD